MNQKVLHHWLFKAGGLQLASVKHRGKKIKKKTQKNKQGRELQKKNAMKEMEKEEKRKLLRVRMFAQ